MRNSTRTGLAICGLLLVGSLVLSASGPSAVQLDPAKTHVGIAKVKLAVSDLRLAEDDKIVGIYELRIPLAPWMNDRGAFQLHAPGPLDEIIVDGATLSGSGRSYDDDLSHPVVCNFGPDGTVEILVETRNHDLSFRTHYRLLGP